MSYKSINYVPRNLRKLNGGRLSETQIAFIVDLANARSESPQGFSQALADARAEFMVSHEMVGGVWLDKEIKA